MATKVNAVFSMNDPAPIVQVNLFEARAYMKNGKQVGEPKFGVVFIFEPSSEELKAAKAKALEIARAKWPGADAKTIRFPFKDGTKEEAKRNKARVSEGKDPLPPGAMHGKVILRSRSARQPALGVFIEGKIVDLEGEKLKVHAGKFYAGVNAVGEFSFAASEMDAEDDEGNTVKRRFVSAYINSVLSMNTGKRLGGVGAPASQRFQGYKGSVTTEDPTAGMDDEIPF